MSVPSFATTVTLDTACLLLIGIDGNPLAWAGAREDS